MSRNLRRYAAQTNLRLLIGFILLLILVGLGLIYLIWGRGAAIFGLACLAAGLAPLVLIWFALVGIDWIAQQANKE